MKKPVRRRLSGGLIAVVAALFLLIGGGIITTLSVQQQGDFSSPESSSSEDSASSGNMETAEESKNVQGIILVNGELYIRKNEAEVPLQEEIGTIKERVSAGKTPEENLTSNFLEEGTVLYETEEEGVLAAELPDGGRFYFIKEDEK
ncbi:hypothetical protein [Salimicrobium flavidum]|uniref:Uncharacterized protein n=1 Tax=Salimicrobium flavidum TaxID=570947 RepID=A0A1N7J7C8_9BACI|nr:hypothetical protein [Salimicrobium flavidum]SIS45263.1 hypothetical protein SAMN05421687_10475 [Salimicrobium flavidum]